MVIVRFCVRRISNTHTQTLVKLYSNEWADFELLNRMPVISFAPFFSLSANIISLCVRVIGDSMHFGYLILQKHIFVTCKIATLISHSIKIICVRWKCETLHDGLRGNRCATATRRCINGGINWMSRAERERWISFICAQIIVFMHKYAKSWGFAEWNETGQHMHDMWDAFMIFVLII